MTTAKTLSGSVGVKASSLKDHVVVLGGSRVARALALQQAALGPVIHAVVGDGAVPPDPAIVPTALSSDPEDLLRATNAGDARLVFIDLDDDTATAAALATLVEGAGRGPVPAAVANIRDPALRRLVDDNLLAGGVDPRPRLISTAALAAASAVASAQPWDLVHWRGQERVHAVVIGFTPLGRACTEELILAGFAGELGKPRITILDPDPLTVRKLIDRDMPEIGLSADIAVAALDPFTLTAPDGPLAAAETEAPVSLVVITLADQHAALDAMTSVARMQERDGQTVAAALLVTEGPGALFRLARPAGRARDLGRSWTVADGIEDDGDILDLVTHKADSLAERLHVAYCRAFPGSGPGNAPWERLSESYRKANRRAAAHLPLKLWTLGLVERGTSPDPFAVDPHTYENVIRPCAESTAEDALLRRLSRIEHDRWCAERRLDGWRFGEVRDDARRIHPKLIPFDDPRLTDEDIEKDADQVRTLFRTVVTAAPEGAVSPLVLGVLSGPHPAPGIPVEAALDLCRKEPWRPVVVLSALLDGAECALVAALDAELSGDGRAWRLVVPEISRDNRELRVVTTAEDAALLRACLDRPSTRFAPIGGRIAPADLWADPSAPDPFAEAIATYITGRSSAIVDSTVSGQSSP